MLNLRIVLVTLLCTATIAGAQDTTRRAATPNNRVRGTGLDLVERMRAAYAGRWYTSLIFTQKTTQRGSDGVEKVTTWYESLRFTEHAGTQLRIDTGSPTQGNGVLYSGDSLWVVRGGKLAAARRGGNALLPLIEGVYMQPVSRTASELAPTGVDLSRPVLTGRWDNRTVLIAGATSAADSISPQFWVDEERNVVVRALLVPVPGTPTMDIRLEGIVPLANGWLATKCSFFVAGALTQVEEYGDWKANVDLPSGLFSIQEWTTALHWANR